MSQSVTARDPSGPELRERKADLEMVVAIASALPQRPPGPLMIPPFRELIRTT